MGKIYCGKKYGFTSFGTGFLIGAALGYFAASVIYDVFVINVIVSAISGFFGARIYVKFLIKRRKKEFTLEFCDYLDAISSSLSCGKNSYEALLIANDDMHNLYPSISPICVESQRISNGLKSGRSIDELFASMAERTDSDDVEIFADVFSICNTAGGNLKQTVCDTKQTITEKITIENEIKTSLAAPRNELNIMATMPIVITAALSILDNGSGEGSMLLINTIAVAIFIGSYALGLKIVNIEV